MSSEAVADDGPASDAIQENGPITVEGVALDPFDSSIEDLAVGKAAPLVSGQSFDGSPIVPLRQKGRRQRAAARLSSCSSPIGAPTATMRSPS